MNNKTLLFFLLVAFNGFAYGMHDVFAVIVHSGLNLQKNIHKNSKNGDVVDQTVFDSQYPDDLKRGYDFKHDYEEFTVVVTRKQLQPFIPPVIKETRHSPKMQAKGSCIKPSAYSRY